MNRSESARWSGVAKIANPQRVPYGKLDVKDVDLYTLTNENGLVLRVSTYGAVVTELRVPDKHGKLADVVLGCDNLDDYERRSPYFGATVGRVANRIRGAAFELEGKGYQLAANDGQHHLHGGMKGWDKVIWTAESLTLAGGPALKLTYVSKDGEEGYPGTVSATTVYTLSNQNEFKVHMSATTDTPTIVNMVHHTYWNLAGFAAGPITDHELTLFADAYTPGDPILPTGQIKPVKGTPFDFTTAKPVGRDLTAVGGHPVGYDHNFIVNGDARAMRPVARLRDPKSGRVMTLAANQPGVHFYSGNFLDGSLEGKGVAYAQHTGLCLETQKFPNSIHVPAWRDEVVLKPGEAYEHVMVHRFTAE